ncbi:DEAD/DEAH box helicase [Glycomyces algeriensis]|uniref:DEAD/DEAH box helicase n=1 Tax=Glycomyces algeriensis TaxID=256037 RepID=A0A9W6LGJ5_9ACTN|nr:DEAD/DEAH box helicase [Glycomyces algeriensis]MDA1366158.1 DEAD/DEAH box helicase [Glycomyces algeriensis]MDR7349073.1 superfamily II DNA/RNA helicase [Glycomyces algeriensis]GLI41774.1 DEAD/DEAH box helicase [Glycomyces algeriensis]
MNEVNNDRLKNEGPTFAQLGVREETVEALAALGIERAFAIQEYAIPIALRGSDIIGRAPTGTGKTFGFGLPIIDRISSAEEGASGKPQALILVPTRELGLQVARDLEDAGKTRGIRVLPIYGGRAYEPQVEALKAGVDIIVGTPGRLLDLYKSKHIKLDAIAHCVLDEADRMLDLGFSEDVEKILKLLPEERQTMLFSATMPDTIMSLSRRHMHRPMTVAADVTGPDQEAAKRTRQLVYMTHALNKVEVTARILQARERGLTILFCRTKRAAQKVADELDFRGFAVGSVHGDLGQNARERALRAFRAGKIDVLVATDVAARGIDVPDITHVINYDAPEEADTYVHRIGRTGRAGATGIAVTFLTWEDLPRWKIIVKANNLDIGEPVETYHTSDHLYTDLDIPEGAPSSLPSDQRKRDGLSAEREENVEGDSRKSGRGRGDRDRGRGGSERRGGGRSGGRGERSERPAAPSERITVDDNGSVVNGTADGGEAPAPRSRQRRRIRTEGAESGAAASAPRQAKAEGDSAPRAEATGEGDAPARRRRRRRRPTGDSDRQGSAE